MSKNIFDKVCLSLDNNYDIDLENLNSRYKLNKIKSKIFYF